MKTMAPIDIHHHTIDRLAFINGFIAGIALYPQVWVVLANGSTAGVSTVTFGIIFLNSIVWLFYAIHRGLISIGIASVLNAVAGSILITSTIVFR